MLINASLYEARRRALGLQTLWVERRTPANEARRAQYDDRIARAEEGLNLKFRAVNAPVRLLHKSLALAKLNEAGLARVGGTPREGDLLLTRMGACDVEATLEAVSELGFLDEICRTAALIPELDVQDAPVERAALIDRLLDRDGLEGILYRLPPQAARVAGDAFVDGLRSLAPPGVEPRAFLDRVVEGSTTLLELDRAAIAFEMSRAIGLAIQITPRLRPVSATPLVASLPRSGP